MTWLPAGFDSTGFASFVFSVASGVGAIAIILFAARLIAKILKG